MQVLQYVTHNMPFSVSSADHFLMLKLGKGCQIKKIFFLGQLSLLLDVRKGAVNLQKRSISERLNSDS